ncbi:MAG TPA: hypothetical protein VG734_17425 [Lacunisphaera sp.]|nr:hypothetical protein [Lacunisphaera sp.]
MGDADPQPQQDDKPQPIDLNALFVIATKSPEDLTSEELELAVKCMSAIP